jgi:hypothetical protein
MDARTIGVIVLLTMVLLQLHAAFSRPRARGDQLLFPVVLSYKCVFILGMVLFASLCLIALYQPGNDKWLALLFLLFFLLALKALPGDLVVTADELMEVRWLGWRKRKIAWRDCVAVLYRPRTGETCVISTSATIIVHTKLHPSRTKFQAAILEYAPISEIAEEKEVTSLGRIL